ncbi:hypothetical protein MCERE19_03840 [Spirosomataceae bacterium]|jgi:hypothetical protein
MSQFTQGGYWVVETNGHMKYKIGDNDKDVIFEIEPETLTNPNRIFELTQQPNFDETEFFILWLKACRFAKLKQVTIKLE